MREFKGGYRALRVVIVLLVGMCLFLFAPSALADECSAGGSHDYRLTSAVQPTEDAEGLYTYTCTKCGSIYKLTIPSTGHEWGPWIEGLAPTCTTSGWEYRVCTKHPDNVHYEYRNVAPLSETGEHDWVEADRVPATEDAEGSVTYVCSICGETYLEILPQLQVTVDESVPETEVVAAAEQSTDTEQPVDDEGVSSEVELEPESEPESEAKSDADVELEPEEQGFFAKDFFTAGPNSVDGVVNSISLAVVLVALVALAFCVAPLAWIRRQQGLAMDHYQDLVRKEREDR